MRREFVPLPYYRLARVACPWAAKIVKAPGGYWCFENIGDYQAWRAQK